MAADVGQMEKAVTDGSCSSSSGIVGENGLPWLTVMQKTRHSDEQNSKSYRLHDLRDHTAELVHAPGKSRSFCPMGGPAHHRFGALRSRMDCHT